jgi:starch synthase (maltosyl-transferring)
MVQSDAIQQSPAPGRHLLCMAGDTITFALAVPADWKGGAWLRTNLGHGKAVRREIIRQVDHRENPLGKSWYDVPMTPDAPGRFRLTLPLTEVGHFEGKSYFLSRDSVDPLWPPGDNTVVNVAPANTCAANIIYNAFVRQFGPNKSGAMPVDDAAVKHLDDSGYTVIPPSGTFRDLIAELDFIIGHLGCRAIQLLPIHPTPTTYARMGRFGSPYAALGFTEVDPALAEFDPTATPLEQFVELVDAIHARGASLLIDIAINHTGWAARLHETHPQWLSREADGQIETPGAWGVVWADLTRLDYRHTDLWQYMADVFLTWCRRGVDGFRCDAGYMIPTPAWRYIIARVRDQFPDTIFLLEGLGGKLSVTRELLNRADFNWAYSELFQNYDRAQIEHYLPGAMDITGSDGLTVHFAETHDNLRLAATSATYARMRTALCALLSGQGGFGFANGVEWLATEKINVHGASSLNWGAADNQIDRIRRLNALLGGHGAFSHPVLPALLQTGAGNCIAALRRRDPGENGLLVAVNLNADAPGRAQWPADRTPWEGRVCRDLLTDRSETLQADKGLHSLALEPGQVVCLAADADSWEQPMGPDDPFPRIPPRVMRQRLRAKALEVWHHYHPSADVGDWDPDRAAERLKAAPLDFCRAMNPQRHAPRTVLWQYPADLKREVMVPPGHFLLVRAAHPFRATIYRNHTVVAAEASLDAADGSAFALFAPQAVSGRQRSVSLAMSYYAPDGCTHHRSSLLYLSGAHKALVRKHFSRPRKRLAHVHMLGTNGRGAMCRGPRPLESIAFPLRCPSGRQSGSGRACGSPHSADAHARLGGVSGFFTGDWTRLPGSLRIRLRRVGLLAVPYPLWTGTARGHRYRPPDAGGPQCHRSGGVPPCCREPAGSPARRTTDHADPAAGRRGSQFSRDHQGLHRGGTSLPGCGEDP